MEDEIDLAEPLVDGLLAAEFSVRLVCTSREALESLKEPWDLVILDLMLPSGSGEALLVDIKKRQSPPEVLVLTAKSGLQDKLALFRLGCDDYITKPYFFDEVLERTRALLRRSRRGAPELAKYDDLVLDPTTFVLSKTDGTQVQLTPKEAAIVRILMQAPEHVIRRKDLLAGGWGLQVEPSINFIGVHVSNLRRKFAQLEREEWLKTVRGFGFSLCKPTVQPT